MRLFSQLFSKKTNERRPQHLGPDNIYRRAANGDSAAESEIRQLYWEIEGTLRIGPEELEQIRDLLVKGNEKKAVKVAKRCGVDIVGLMPRLEKAR